MNLRATTFTITASVLLVLATPPARATDLPFHPGVAANGERGVASGGDLDAVLYAEVEASKRICRAGRPCGACHMPTGTRWSPTFDHAQCRTGKVIIL